jgi:hypothetical protein
MLSGLKLIDHAKCMQLLTLLNIQTFIAITSIEFSLHRLPINQCDRAIARG